MWTMNEEKNIEESPEDRRNEGLREELNDAGYLINLKIKYYITINFTLGK